MQEVVESVVVPVERTIRVGTGYTIVPSEPFLGLERGRVKVVALHSYDSMDEATKKEAEDQWIDMTKSWDEHDLAEQYKKELWVLFKYTDRENKHMHLHPISVFAYHIVPLY